VVRYGRPPTASLLIDRGNRCQYHSRPRRFSQYLHLAISIITDLQLDRPTEHRFWKTRVGIDHEQKRNALSWGREEERAVIGYFYLSSWQVHPRKDARNPILTTLMCFSISQILQKRCSFSYIPYFDNMCKTLAADAEYPSDRYLLHIVQLQRISEKVTLVTTQSIKETNNPGYYLENEYRTMRSELEVYRVNLPFSLTESRECNGPPCRRVILLTLNLSYSLNAVLHCTVVSMSSHGY
jgi:hypothetical protein